MTGLKANSNTAGGIINLLHKLDKTVVQVVKILRIQHIQASPVPKIVNLLDHRTINENTTY